MEGSWRLEGCKLEAIRKLAGGYKGLAGARRRLELEKIATLIILFCIPFHTEFKIHFKAKIAS